MKPFLLIQSRPEDETSDSEYEAFLRYSGLQPHQLQRFRIESNPLPKLILDDYSGILVGGGPFNSSDPAEHKSGAQQRVEQEMNQLLNTIIAKDYPFLGACYGIGLLGTHQGGIINKKYAEEVGAKQIEIAKSDPILEGINSPFTAFAGHKEACEKLPRNATLLATSKECPVQMFKIKHNIYATQFHPELDSDGLETRIRIYKHHGYFKPEETESLIAHGHSVKVTEPMKILKNFISLYSV